jgi:SAM-dependent methyltransferase
VTTHVYEGRDLEAMAFARNYSAWIRDEIGDCIGGDVAEVGAGDGRFAALLHEGAPSSLTLFEPSAGMFERLQSRMAGIGRVACVNATLASVAAEFRGAFDTVIYNNVLEHIADDAGELAIARRVLRPGGRLCIFVPAMPWLMSDFDRRIGHLRRYTFAGLKELLVQSGFSIERLHYFDAPGTLPWLVAMRWLSGDLDARKTRMYDRIAVPLVRAVETRWRPPFGKNLLAVARAPLETSAG